jgi:tRNA(His) 5'-end guanylyltransferase
MVHIVTTDLKRWYSRDFRKKWEIHEMPSHDSRTLVRDSQQKLQVYYPLRMLDAWLRKLISVSLFICCAFNKLQPTSVTPVFTRSKTLKYSINTILYSKTTSYGIQNRYLVCTTYSRNSYFRIPLAYTNTKVCLRFSCGLYVQVRSSTILTCARLSRNPQFR